MGTKEGKAREIGIVDAFGFEVVDGGDEVIGGLRRWEIARVGVGMDNAYGFKVADVFAVRCAEFEVERRRRGFGWPDVETRKLH